MEKRWFYITVIVVLAVVTLILAVQNLESVTFSFLGLRLTMPLAVLIGIVYVMGAATGGSLWGLIRWVSAGVKRSGL